MNPFSINPLALLGGLAIAIVIGFGGGWTAQGWRLTTQIAEAKAERSDETAQRAEVALTDLTEASKKINEAAGGARVDFDAVLNKLAAIDRRYKDAKPPVLPPDCKPDPIRVRRLYEAAAASSEATTRSEPGR